MFLEYIIYPLKKHIKNLILKIINKNTDSFHGIGRTQLIYELKNYGVSISDSKVRNITQRIY